MDNDIKATTYGSLNHDMWFNKKVSISFDSVEFDSTADFKVLVQIEPPTILNVVNQIPSHKDNFDLILTWHPNVLTSCDNSKLFPFGSSWISEEDRGIPEKNKTLSIISSDKRQTIGHRLRHEIISSSLTPMDIYGRGYKPIDNKIVGLRDYMFSLIIENDRSENWFTEKIVDCLVTGTVPVYWGCDNIGDYFNTRGFIQFRTIEEFKEIIPKLNSDTYIKMLPFINENFNISLKYTDFWNRVESTIKHNLK